MITQAITQLNELSYDVNFWVDRRLHEWLDECNFEFSMATHGAPPCCWILEFKDYGESAMFKMAWLNV